MNSRTLGLRRPGSAAASLLCVLMLAMPAAPLSAQLQQPPAAATPDDSPANDDTPSSPEKVEVDPLAQDSEIADRLARILAATDRFQNMKVEVKEGVVFLSGTTRKDEFREWAGELARRTGDVVAVVNRIEVQEGSIWDLSPAWAEIRGMSRELIQSIPLIGLAVVLLLVTWVAASLAMRLADTLLARRLNNRLLRQVATRAVAVPVFLLGVYLTLRVSGLTQVAATVLGGTGLIGLMIGIAFRDIAENFLASILISVQRPFSIGDLIEVAGQQGYVQSVTTRGTLLMTLNGNHVQIPNSTIYKDIIHNYTANPGTRLSFLVGVGYTDSITRAQDVALETLRQHPVVLADPEPLVLVDELGASAVNLQVYFWINGHEHSMLKARSSVIRLVKRAFEKNGISMPDEAREVIFPEGVPIVRPKDAAPAASPASQPPSGASPPVPAECGEEEVQNEAEGDLSSEAGEIQQQAAMSRQPGNAPNLLEERADSGP